MSDQTLIERRPNAKASFPLLAEMIVEPGAKDDWLLLHELHYKADKLPAGVRYWKCTLHGETIGVLVTAAPKLLLKERHIVFPNVKPGAKETYFTNTYRAVWLNKKFRVVSRFVVDTMYRGVGIAYRMQNLVSRMEGPQIMEIQSSMSKYNTFAQRAGFFFCKPLNSNKFEPGIRFFRKQFTSNPADYEGIKDELAAMSEPVRDATIAAMKDFYFKNSALEKTGQRGRGKVQRIEKTTVPYLIKNIQQMALASPLYGFYRNPDFNQAIPQRLPLSAFDWQGPQEPFNTEAYQQWTT